MKKALFLGVAVVLLLTGCAAQQEAKIPDGGSQPPTGGIAYFAPKYEIVSQTPDELVVEVKNQNTTVATYNYSSGQKFDLRLSQNGKVAYTWSADKLFIQATSVSTVKQAESEIYTVDLTDLPVEKGNYELEFWSVAKELKDVQPLKLNITIK